MICEWHNASDVIWYRIPSMSPKEIEDVPDHRLGGMYGREIVSLWHTSRNPDSQACGVTPN